MSEPDDDVARLRAGFAARSAAVPAGHECPDPGQIWDAACGLLAAEERRSIVDAVAACGACAEAWRLAVEVAREVTPAEVAARDVTPAEAVARDVTPAEAVVRDEEPSPAVDARRDRTPDDEMGHGTAAVGAAK